MESRVFFINPYFDHLWNGCSKYLLNYSPSWEATICSTSKRRSAFLGMLNVFQCSWKSATGPYPSHTNPTHIFRYYNFNMSFVVIYHLHLGFFSRIFFPGLTNKISYEFCILSVSNISPTKCGDSERNSNERRIKKKIEWEIRSKERNKQSWQRKEKKGEMTGKW